MENTYWNGKGKYEVLLSPLNDEGGGEGMGTPNNYLTKSKKQAIKVAMHYMRKN